MCRPVRARVSGVVPVWPLILRGKWRGEGGETEEEEQGGGKVLVRRRRRQGEGLVEMVTVQGGRNYRRSRHGGVYNRRPEEGRDRETNRETQGGWRGGLGDCVRARQSEEWRVQTRSGHGTSCCARSIERSNHLCSHTMPAMANKLVYVCLRVYNTLHLASIGSVSPLFPLVGFGELFSSFSFFPSNDGSRFFRTNRKFEVNELSSIESFDSLLPRSVIFGLEILYAWVERSLTEDFDFKR